MRPKLRQFTRITALFSIALITGVVFQNCAGYNGGYNPLYDREQPSECNGITCKDADLQSVSLSIANEQPIGIAKPGTGVTPVSGDQYSAIDISGFCDVAGYPDSAIYYQWMFNGQPFTSMVRTSAKCDELGRFRINVVKPANYVYENIYSVVVTMKVIDIYGNEFDNPVGTHRKEITVAKQL